MNQAKKKRKDFADILFDVIKYVVLTVFVALCIYPFYYVIIYSISVPVLAERGGVYLWPKGFSLKTYSELLKRSDLMPAFWVSAARTVLGTTITVICTALLSFLMTRKEMWFRKFAYRFSITTMYLGAGLIPWYLIMKAYGFQNNFLLYIIPSALNVYHMILIKTFMEQLPESLEESAAIEGAGFLSIFFKIILPLSKPIIASVAVYNTVGQWNSWQDNFFLNSDRKLQTLQMVLQNYLKSANILEALMKKGAINAEAMQKVVTSDSIQMTAIVVTIFPIMLVYPFAQKYFTKGIMMGAVKG